ncbi:hypothetical protein GOP47_0013892 [Adiantum capillus-veneris]|uniref:lysine--tRNA ligase n=1 Tax=Adiantum capillus-veneris TaxID=13818 RepID=A0A9D4UQ29_ADICA|nr:hypothetical protein GOP47_0013892 [Adiantum capillus-veneris]
MGESATETPSPAAPPASAAADAQSVSKNVPDYVKQFLGLLDGEHKPEWTVSVAGRILNKRSSLVKLLFYDLIGEGVKVQVMADAKNSGLSEPEFAKLHASIKRGDIVGVQGFPGKSKKGELSIFPTHFQVLSPCLHMLPRQKGSRCKEGRDTYDEYDCWWSNCKTFHNSPQ